MNREKYRNSPCRKCGLVNRNSAASCIPCIATKPCTRCGVTDRYPANGVCRPCAIARQKTPKARADRDRRRAVPESRERERANARRRNAGRWARDAEFRRKSQEGRRKREADPEKRRAMREKARYRVFGLSPEEQRTMLAAQNDRCACCGDVLNHWRKTHLDHDHVTGEIRGFTCNYCNVAAAMVKDDPDRARKLAAYLERHAPKLRLVKS
jgi:hypothetical protein